MNPRNSETSEASENSDDGFADATQAEKISDERITTTNANRQAQGGRHIAQKIAKNVMAEADIVDGIARLQDRAMYLSKYLESMHDLAPLAYDPGDARTNKRGDTTAATIAGNGSDSGGSDVEALQSIVQRDHNIHVGVAVTAPSLFDSPQTSVAFIEDMLQQVRYALSKARKVKPLSSDDVLVSTDRPPSSGIGQYAYATSTRAIALVWLQTARRIKNAELAASKNPTSAPPLSLGVASKSMAFARLRSAENRLMPFLALLERCLALKNMHNKIAKKVLREEKKISRKLEKISAPLCASPWGIASRAAQKLVEAKRRDAEANRKLTSESLRSSLKRNRKTLSRLGAIRCCIEDDDILALRGANTKMSSGVSLFQSVSDFLQKPLWWLEWECGRLQAEKEFLSSCVLPEGEGGDTTKCLELAAYRWYIWAGWAGQMSADAETLAEEAPSYYPTPEQNTNNPTFESNESEEGASGHHADGNKTTLDPITALRLKGVEATTAKSIANATPRTQTPRSSSHTPRSSSQTPRTPRRTNTPRRPDSSSRNYGANRQREVESPHGVKTFFSASGDAATSRLQIAVGQMVQGVSNTSRRRGEPRNYNARVMEIESPHGVRKFFPEYGGEETKTEGPETPLQQQSLSSSSTFTAQQDLFYAVPVEGQGSEATDYALAACAHGETEDTTNDPSYLWNTGLSYNADIEVEYPGEDDECGYAHGYWYQVARRYNDGAFFKQFFWWQQMSSASTAADANKSTSEELQENTDARASANQQKTAAEDAASTASGGSGRNTNAANDDDAAAAMSGNTGGSDSRAAPFEYEDDYEENEFIEIDLVVRVMADYERRDETELSLREGELIRVLRQDISGWWSGCKERETGEAAVGWFPSNFVHEKHLIWGLLEEVDGDEEEDVAFPEDI